MAISTIGAILLGIGALLFVASNWRAMTELMKFIGLMLSFLLTNQYHYYANWILLLIFVSIPVGFTCFIYVVTKQKSIIGKLLGLALLALSFVVLAPILLLMLIFSNY